MTCLDAQPYNRRTVRIRRRTIVLVTMAVATAVFLVVQDRVTAAGARRYVVLHRDAVAGHRAAATIDEVMVPAIRESVWQGLLWSGVVLMVGLAGAACLPREGIGRE